ncbi:MAG: deoxyribose-phosphate aldolase [Cyanobacteria bacterium]|nr:deoxyribose-phosphate aldolase [Cyanobacteriota bacterium]
MVFTLTREQLAKTIDLTYLKPVTSVKEIESLCKNAKKYHFASLCINPCMLTIAKRFLADSDVKVCSVVGLIPTSFTTETKVFESKDNVKKGADEIDVMMNLGALKSGNYTFIEKELLIIVNVIRREQMAEYNKHINIKIIIETGNLLKDEIKKVCKIIEDIGADFIQTSTGYGARGVELDDIRLIREVVTRNIGVKASGGIRTFKDAQALIDAGATRLGTSAGVEIMEEYINLFDK